jgi:hypothetical protein
MPEPLAVVMVTKTEGGHTRDTEHPVRTLHDLYAVCCSAPPSDVVRVLLKGEAGDVWLNFASFIHRT